MADYKEKIKKLLALSKSPNEHELSQLLQRHSSLWQNIKSLWQKSKIKKKERQMNIQLELLIRLEEIPGC